MMIKNLVVKIQNLVVNHESQLVKLNPVYVYAYMCVCVRVCVCLCVYIYNVLVCMCPWYIQYFFRDYLWFNMCITTIEENKMLICKTLSDLNKS